MAATKGPTARPLVSLYKLHFLTRFIPVHRKYRIFSAKPRLRRARAQGAVVTAAWRRGGEGARGRGGEGGAYKRQADGMRHHDFSFFILLSLPWCATASRCNISLKRNARGAFSGDPVAAFHVFGRHPFLRPVTRLCALLMPSLELFIMLISELPI
jgi:hypothetical protein